MKTSLLVRLWVMAFVQYAIWGLWYVTMGTYLTRTLHFSGGQVGLAYGTPAIGAMISPFLVGLVADRFFAAERILAALHLMGAGLLYFVSTTTSFPAFYGGLIAHTIGYMATLALTNTLTLRHVTNPGRQFPLVMLMGSVGWIAAGLVIGQAEVEAAATQFQWAALASAAMGLYCLTLPPTPPLNRERSTTLAEALGFDALRLLRHRSFAVFLLGSFLICVPLSFYFSWTNVFLNEIGVKHAASKMTLGQVSDVTFLLLMPFFVGRLGVKRMLLLGMLAWTVRFGLFYLYATGLTWPGLLYTGIALHGICYDFFFVMGRIYVDRRAPEHLRATAQGLLAFVTLGTGMFVGTWLSGLLGESSVVPRTDGTVLHDWSRVWIIPSMMSGAVLLGFALLFRDDDRELVEVASGHVGYAPTDS
ncbi:nucleoside transporter [Singulisphaera sp. GP187]|uniref:MFS transporter n=1 Tax=Singulisphaera sp. GP187 TaxID=1882752 RepID=UPI000929BD99|nr:MFS transporter [Singulisphaera sp. GP187]SIO61431.1 nucleoside transporter [Singulisphaera sp. GP187]